MLRLARSMCFAALLLGGGAAHAQRHEHASEERAPRYIADAGDARPTPVPILKQVNRHNEDGSYTYGYEAADGSFKIETKLANGEVKGKYGYRDDTGKVRTVEYGANKYGFQPSGEGITVAPPTLVDDSAAAEPAAAAPARSQFSSGGAGARAQYRPQPAPADYDYEEPAPRAPPAPAYRAPPPAPAYRAPAARLRTAAAAPAPPKPAFFAGAAPAPAPVVDDEGGAYFRPAAAGAAGAAGVTYSARAAPQPQYSQDIQFGGQNQLFTSAAPAPRKQYAAQQYPAQQQYSGVQEPAQQYPAQQQYSGVQEYSGQQYSGQQYSTQQYSGAQQAARRPAGEPYSRLDELIREYGLPAGGAAPLHDITFGSY